MFGRLLQVRVAKALFCVQKPLNMKLKHKNDRYVPRSSRRSLVASRPRLMIHDTIHTALKLSFGSTRHSSSWRLGAGRVYRGRWV